MKWNRNKEVERNYEEEAKLEIHGQLCFHTYVCIDIKYKKCYFYIDIFIQRKV